MTTEDTGGKPLLGVIARGLQFALIALVGYSALTGNVGLAINGVLALAVAFVPTLLEWRYDHYADPLIEVWIAAAAVVHTAGFLGPYQAQSGLWSWYDQAAHAISASFVAGVAYALFVALDRTSTRIQFPDGFRSVFTLFFILAFGVGWEIVEFGAGTLSSMLVGSEALIQYGMDDIVLDLVFNTLAAALVTLWGIGHFGDLAALFSRRLFERNEP